MTPHNSHAAAGKGAPMLLVILMWLGKWGLGAGGGGIRGRRVGWGERGVLQGFGLLHEYSSSALHQTVNKQKPSPLMVVLSGVVGAGGAATPLVTGLDGVLNMRSVNENVPLSTVISLKRLSSFQAAVSSSNSLPVRQRTLVLLVNSTTAVATTLGVRHTLSVTLEFAAEPSCSSL